MAAASDNLTITLADQADKMSPFVKETYSYVLDNSLGGFTSGQVVIDATSFATSSSWNVFSESYIELPVTIKAYASAALTTDMSAFGAGFKNGGALNLLDSVMVEINGTTIHQQVRSINEVLIWKLMSSLSASDLLKDGATLQFAPDEPASWAWAAAASPSGLGLTNNLIAIPAAGVDFGLVATGQTASVANSGLLKRQTYLSYDVAAGGRAAFTSVANMQTMAQAYFAETGIANQEYVWYMMATLRLKDIAPVFATLPPVKGLAVRLTLGLNQSDTVISCAAAATGNITAVTNAFPYGGSSTAVMFDSRVALNGNSGIAAAAAFTVTLSTRCGATPFTSGTAALNPLGTQARLWVKQVTMQPSQEAEYISNPVRRLYFNDVVNYNIAAVTAGQNVTSLLTNGLKRLRALLMVPKLNATSNFGGLAQQVSPFVSGATAPAMHPTNFQVMVSTESVFPQPISYGYRHFLENLRAAPSVNYGKTEGLCSGLISQQGFEVGLDGYIYVDLSRCVDSTDDISRSVSVQFTHTGLLQADYFCYLLHEKVLDINVLSGAIVNYN